MGQTLRDELLRIFRQWEDGQLTSQAVLNWAKRTSSAGADECCAEVLRHMRGLDVYLITSEDLPVYRESLARDPVAGLSYLKQQEQNMDVVQRATELQHDNFYGPHTKAILKDLDERK
jgi:hypothetical protein